MDDEKNISELLDKPLHRRLRGYFRMTGPGYMQSAMTLGGGSVAASVYFGSLAGYELLWVQPLSMLLGYFVMAAIAKQGEVAVVEESHGRHHADALAGAVDRRGGKTHGDRVADDLDGLGVGHFLERPRCAATIRATRSPYTGAA